MYYILISSFLEIKKIKIIVFYFFICIIYINLRMAKEILSLNVLGKPGLILGKIK
jgi:hypothetical protein